MTSYVPIGVCKVQLDPVCEDGAPDAARQAIVVCNALNVDVNTRLTDGFTIEDPSGIPGQNCIELELPGTLRPPEIVIDTCNVFDPEFDAIASGTNEIVVDIDGNFVGVQAQSKDGENCLCSCEDAVEPCNRWDMTIWSLAYCAGSTGARHPDGRFVVKRYPNIEFQPQTATVSTTNELGGARQYLAYGYESTNGYLGPADITPTELDFNRCALEFLSDQCPPGECGCGGCDAQAEAPLARAARRRRAVVDTTAVETSEVPNADELANA